MKAKDFRKRADFIALILRFSSLLLCISALLAPLSTGLQTKVASDSGSVITNYGPAFAFLFGGEISTGRVTYTAMGVSVVGTIAYCLTICAAIALIVFMIIRRNKKSKFLVLGSSIALLVASIMAISSHDSVATVLADSILGRRSDSVVATMIRTSTLQFGFWGISLFGFIAVALLLGSFIFDGTLDEIKTKISSR